MKLESKLKRAALDTALSHLVKGSKKSPERIARNILDIVSSISNDTIDETQKSFFQKDLLKLLDKNNYEELRSWIIKTFHI